MGVIVKETPAEYHVVSNLLTPKAITLVKKNEIDEQFLSKISPMPDGLVNVLQRDEINDLLSFLQTGGYKMPGHLKHQHGHHD